MVTMRHRRLALRVGLATLAAGGWLVAQDVTGLSAAAAHDQSRTVERCVQCHAIGDPRRSPPTARGGCDAQCIECHAADTVSHHPVGAVIPPLRSPDLARSSEGRIACRTCHDLARPALDSVPWRAQSLFDAVFRRQPHYPTYYLAVRNQRGRLCQSCH